MKTDTADTGVANFVQKAFDIISVSYLRNLEHLVLQNHSMVYQWERIHNQRYLAVWVDNPPKIFPAQKHQ